MYTFSHVFNYHKLTNNKLSSEPTNSLLKFQSKYCNIIVPPIPILKVSGLDILAWLYISDHLSAFVLFILLKSFPSYVKNKLLYSWNILI